MGKVVPFQKKTKSLEELASTLVLRIKEGKFNHADSREIIKKIEISSRDDANVFLTIIAPVAEALDWKYHLHSVRNPEKNCEIEKIRSMPGFQDFIVRIDQIPEILRVRHQIYTDLFQDDRFLDKIYHLVPLPKELKHDYSEVKATMLGKSDLSVSPKIAYSKSDLQNFLSHCFKIIISKYGILEQLMCLDLFSSYSLSKELSEEVARKLLIKQYDLKCEKELRIEHIIEELIEKYLTAKFKNEELGFVNLYRLLILRYRLKKGYDNVCNALINAVEKTGLDDILTAFELYDEIENEYITYTPEYSQETSDFHRDLYLALHDANKLNFAIANNAFLYADDLTECPLGFLILASIYGMDENPGKESSALAIEGFLAATKIFSSKSLYEEALACFKAALFNTITLLGVDLRNRLDFSDYKEITRKLNGYENSITFLSKFEIISAYGFPIPQGILNEIGITKRELEYEHDATQSYEIDNFYEVVAKENFSSVYSHLVRAKGSGKWTLTADQLEILIKKIQEKASIIEGLKRERLDAKLDMMMDKQAAIFSALQENHEALKDLIISNTEKIIEDIHERNQSLFRDEDMSAYHDHYKDILGGSLWESLNEWTCKYLLQALHLERATKYSLVDEFSGIAVEYALAIENEFKTKIIDPYLAQGQSLSFRHENDTIATIEQSTKITMGMICNIIKQAKKGGSNDSALCSFYNFIDYSTVGQKKIFSFKENLFEINRHRNKAAHFGNYSRESFDSLKSLLFLNHFLKNFFDAIQLKQ
jgi:hypothetical protein